MKTRRPNITRRQMTGLVLATPVVTPMVFGALGAVACTKPCYEQQLRDVLAGIRFPHPPAELSLQYFEQVVQNTGQNSETLFQAVVRLTWAPGLRTRLFVTHDRDADWAYAKLVGQIEGYFLSLS